MYNIDTRSGRGKPAGRIVTWALAFCMALGLFGFSSGARTAAAPNVAPQIVQSAAEQPNAMVKVIVQKMSAEDNLEAAVGALGGEVTADLHIIRGFAARMPAQAAVRLGQDPRTRWISLDGPMIDTGTSGPINVANLQSAYVKAIGADRVWNESPNYYQGQNIGVAVVDSGVNPQQDFYTTMGVNHLVYAVQFNGGYNQTTYDGYGHGTHVAGIIANTGFRSNNTYMGVAPNANIINVKVSDDLGASTASNVVSGLQWINDNKSQYNIRVANISLNSNASTNYNTDPIDAAVEVLWFNRVVVVVSAGNNGTTGALYSPANDPFVITVGATNDRGTAGISDDTLASFSAYGTVSGVAKPDLVAPGTNIVSLAGNMGMGLSAAHPDHIVYYNGSPAYFRMSGTSMAAPMVAGAAALLLQSNPNLTPDQVKYRLKATAVHDSRWPAYNSTRAGAGLLDIYAAVHSNTNSSANTGLPASSLLWTGSQPLNWGSVNWNSVNWNSVNWNSVNWNSVNWNSVNWNSDWWAP